MYFSVSFNILFFLVAVVFSCSRFVVECACLGPSERCPVAQHNERLRELIVRQRAVRKRERLQNLERQASGEQVRTTFCRQA